MKSLLKAIHSTNIGYPRWCGGWSTAIYETIEIPFQPGEQPMVNFRVVYVLRNDTWVVSDEITKEFRPTSVPASVFNDRNPTNIPAPINSVYL